MRMQRLENGCLTILLSDQELSGMGVSFGTLNYQEPATRQALKDLLSAAQEQAGLPPDKHMLVEALPVEEGCLLLVTPLPRRRQIRMRRLEKPRVYAIADTNSLLALAVGMGRTAGHLPPLLASSLYRFEGGYRLVVYPARTPARLWRLLSEFGRAVGEGETAAAIAAEHGTPIALGNALDRLMRAARPAL